MADRRSVVIWTLGSLFVVGIGVAAGITKGPISGALFALAGLVPALIAVVADILSKKKARKKEQKRFGIPS
jgi:hypothetical protein